MLITLIILACVLAYAWILYPAVAMWLGRAGGRECAVGCKQGAIQLPSVAILLSAHNEEAEILKRLENLAALNYPAELLHVHLGVDGGGDRTAEIALEWAKSHPRVSVLVSRQNQGKTAMLKKLAAGSRGSSSLLVFTDANTCFAPDAIYQLVLPFSDAKVGGVCGRLIFLDEAGTETRENLYWKMETLLKAAESRMDSCLGANGAIYAIRAELFWAEIPDSTIIDDFVIGMKVREQGFRMVYEPQAVAYEQTPARIADEWRRRVRIGAGAFQAMAYCYACLSPKYGRFALIFWSHKMLRWFTPHLMLLLAAVAVTSGLYGEGASVVCGGGILAAGAGFVLLALLGRFIGVNSRLKAFEYFLSMQVALFVGFLRYCRGGLKGSWERTERGTGGGAHV